MTALDNKIKIAIKQKYVGNTQFSDGELAELFDKTGTLLRSYVCWWGNTISSVHDEMVFVAMVNAAKSWDASDDRFWDFISRKLTGAEGSHKTYIYFTKVIERLGTEKKIIYLNGCSKRYYATILAHAFSPKHSIYAFLELCWQLYIKDLNFNYYSEDDLFSLVGNELKQRFSHEKSSEEDFSLGSEVYSLRAGIKRLAIELPKEMSSFINLTVSLIDKAFNGELLDSENYYDSIIKKWWILKSASFGQKPPQRKIKEARSITDYSHIRPKYMFNGSHVVLFIPSVRLKDNFYDNPHILIFHNGELVDNQELLTFGSGLSMATKSKEIYVDNLLDADNELNFELSIIHYGKEIYSSGRSLIRQFVLFKDQREILQNECLPGNYMIYTPNIDSLSVIPKNIKKKDYNLYVFSAENDESISGSRRTVFFVNEKQKRNIRIAADRKSNVHFLHNGENYEVIDGDLRIYVAPDIDIRQYGVRYEDVDFRLCEFDCEENNSEKCFCITQLLSVCEPQKIIVFNYSTSQIEASFGVVKFNSIKIKFDKNIYYDNNSVGTVEFHTDKYDKFASFDIKNGDVTIPFPDGDIIISPPVFRWKIANMKYQTEFREDLWYRNFPNSALLCIEAPAGMKYKVLYNNKSLSECSYNNYKIGEALYSSVSNNDCMSVFIEFENIGTFPVCSIQIKEKFRYAPILIIDKQLFWDPRQAFIGDKNADFIISVLAGEKMVFSRSVTLSPQRIYLDEFDIGRYVIYVDIIKKRAFTQDVRQCLFEMPVVLGNLNAIRFRKKRLYIKELMLTEEIAPHRIKPFWIDQISYIKDEDGNSFYCGRIFVIDRYGRKIYLDKMSDEDGNIAIMNPVRLELRTESTCFIVAGYNKYDWYDFVGEFTFDTQSNKIGNLQREGKGIDYYLFNTEENT